jgi:hypothetical protein
VLVQEHQDPADPAQGIRICGKVYVGGSAIRAAGGGEAGGERGVLGYGNAKIDHGAKPATISPDEGSRIGSSQSPGKTDDR